MYNFEDGLIKCKYCKGTGDADFFHDERTGKIISECSVCMGYGYAMEEEFMKFNSHTDYIGV